MHFFPSQQKSKLNLPKNIDKVNGIYYDVNTSYRKRGKRRHGSRTKVENEAIKLISACKFEEAMQLLAGLEN